MTRASGCGGAIFNFSPTRTTPPRISRQEVSPAAVCGTEERGIADECCRGSLPIEEASRETALSSHSPTPRRGCARRRRSSAADGAYSAPSLLRALSAASLSARAIAASLTPTSQIPRVASPGQLVPLPEGRVERSGRLVQPRAARLAARHAGRLRHHGRLRGGGLLGPAEVGGALGLLSTPLGRSGGQVVGSAPRQELTLGSHRAGGTKGAAASRLLRASLMRGPRCGRDTG